MPILLPIFFLLFVALVPAMAQTNPIAQDPTSAAATVIKGYILYVEGEYLVVKEVSGRESRVHVNGETKIAGVAGRLKAGDKIEATVTSDGHATAIALQGLESSPLPALP